MFRIVHSCLVVYVHFVLYIINYYKIYACLVLYASQDHQIEVTREGRQKSHYLFIYSYQNILSLANKRDTRAKAIKMKAMIF